MGFNNRDYMQDDYQSRGSTWGHDVPTTKWLIIITVIVFFLQTLMTYPPGAAFAKGGSGSYVEDWFNLDSAKVLHGQVWRLVTYVFCHDRVNAFGMAFNMIAVWFLGSTLERMYGYRELLWFYLFSAIACGLIFVGFGLAMFLPKPLMGAGPCVMALLTLYATYYPTREILVFWVVPVQVRVLLGIYVAIDALTIMQAFKGDVSWVTVAYRSEIWGVAYGYLYRRTDWRFAGFFDVFDVRRMQQMVRRATTTRKLKVFKPESTNDLDEQVDAILAKIHEQGSESLTDRERSILQKASEKAKGRI